MAEPLPEALGWLDARKRQVVAELATALGAPETIGPNIWGAIKDLARNVSPQLEDTGDPVQNSRNLMMGLASFSPGIAKLALRSGALSPEGAHFATRGSSTWFDPQDPDIGWYNIGKTKVLDTQDPTAMLPVLKDLVKHPAVKALKDPKSEVSTVGTSFNYGDDAMDARGPELRQALAQALRDARAGKPPVMSYVEAETTPLKETAQKHGYGGYKVWENDDWSDPSTHFIWDLNSVRPHGPVASEAMQHLHDVLKWNAQQARPTATIFDFPGGPPIPPRYPVAEEPMTPELASKFGLQPEMFDKIKAIAAALAANERFPWGEH